MWYFSFLKLAVGIGQIGINNVSEYALEVCIRLDWGSKIQYLAFFEI